MNFRVHVALTNYTSRTLSQIAGSPWAVEVVKRNQSVLTICTCSHFLGTADENTDISAPDFCEKLLFLRFCVRVMNESDFRFRHSAADEFVSNVGVDAESSLFRR